MRSESESFEILGRALAAASADQADAVFVASDRNISRFANSTIHQNMSEETAELILRVIIGGAAGVASTTVFDAGEIARTAGLARDAARHSKPIPGFRGLYAANEPAPLLRTFDQTTAQISPRQKAETLRSAFDRARRVDATFAGSYATAARSVATANSNGVRRYCRITSADATAIAVHARGSGYATRCARSCSSLDVAALAGEALQKALLSSDAMATLEPGSWDVILEPAAVAEVLDWVNMIALSGQSFEDGSSFFVGNIGKRILGHNLTMADDAVDEDFLPFPFDLEGLPKRRVGLIEKGIPRTPVVDKAYADRLGVTATANAWHLGSPEHGSAFHMAINGGESTREDLIGSTERGIWVTRFNYVNGLLEPKTALMTGTTRDGTFLIRNGKVVARLPNLRWTQSIVEAFNRVEGMTRERRAIGTWYNPYGGTLVPVMKIRDWRFDL
ncbi:MAG TPA: TldD/PmbA family protein [Thermoanaerobaculia bacterium]|nr:TldD/PmbA family protein [Thermoanaerobaculia bacterium]